MEGTLRGKTETERKAETSALTHTHTTRRASLALPLAISFSLSLWLLLTAASGVTEADLDSEVSGLGRERGRNQKGMLEMKRRAEDTRKPNHQAPTQRASFTVMVTLSAPGQKNTEQSL